MREGKKICMELFLSYDKTGRRWDVSLTFIPISPNYRCIYTDLISS